MGSLVKERFSAPMSHIKITACAGYGNAQALSWVKNGQSAVEINSNKTGQ
jgi:hypothetical protein